MNKLIFRPFCDSDIQKLEEWLRKDHVLRYYHDPQEWIKECKERNEAFAFLNHFIVFLDTLPIGFCQYYDCFYAKEEWYNVDVQGEVFSIDYLIGEEIFLGKGYGKAIVAELIEMLKQKKANEIVVLPEIDNVPSCKALVANGFVYDESRKYFYLKLTRCAQ